MYFYSQILFELYVLMEEVYFLVVHVLLLKTVIVIFTDKDLRYFMQKPSLFFYCLTVFMCC